MKPAYPPAENVTTFSARPVCEHDYEEVKTAWNSDYERYKCKKCGNSYNLYYDEMR